jgi:hypothetical protein
MIPSRLRFALAGFLLLAAPSAARADCPLSSASCSGHGVDTAAPAYAASCDGHTVASFDIPAATLDQNAPGYESAYGSSAWIILRDEFTVHAPTSGTPFDLHLRVHARGHAFAAGGFGDTAGLILNLKADPEVPLETYAYKAWGTFDGSLDFDDSLDVVLHRTTGAPIGIAIDSNLGAAAYCSSNAHLEFRFVDLPAGWSVTSCKGFDQEQPVPARPVSWGSLKAAYR